MATAGLRLCSVTGIAAVGVTGATAEDTVADITVGIPAAGITAITAIADCAVEAVRPVNGRPHPM